MNIGREKTIGLFIPAFTGGGAEILTCALANEFTRLGHRACVIAMIQGKDLAHFDVQTPVHILGTSRIWRAALSLGDVVRRSGVDVLISSLPLSNLVADFAIVRRYTRVPVINTWHGFIGSATGAKTIVAQIGSGLLSRIASHNIVVSNSLKRELIYLGAPTRRVDVVYNGISLSSDSGALFDLQKPYALSVGSLTRHKNHALLIRAFAIFRRENDWDLVIAGQGPLEHKLRGLAADLDISNRVHFVGFRDDLDAFYKGASLFALPSRHETFGIVLLEALKHGLPIVSTDSGGPREVLEQGRFGRIVAKANAKDFAEAMIQTVKSPPNPQLLRNRAEYFTIENTAIEYMRIINLILATG